MAFSAPSKQVAQSMAFPAPVKGVVATDTIYGSGDLGLDSAIWLYNMIAGEYGCRVRKGSQAHASGLYDAAGELGEVRTLLFYNSIQAGGAKDQFFACTSAGIYDITTATTTPTLVFEWPNKDTATAGWVSHINYTNVGGDHYMLLCDEANGYYIFDGATFTQGTFTGNPKPDPENLVQITEWQNRIWFVERDTARAWFLDPLSLTGDIAPMDVGNRFIKGGHLVQNTTWTMDDGAGMDDKFIQISASGDVLVWAGTNPTTADDMTLVGRWYVGAVPEGRRVMSQWGGEVLILTSTGLLRASAIIEGVATTDFASHMTNNITRYIRQKMATTLDDYGWGMEFMPSEGVVLISTPLSAGKPFIQFVMNVHTGSWSIYRDLDMVCMDKNNNGFYFGTHNGEVYLHDGHADEVALDGDTTNARPIAFSLLTHYSHMNNPAAWKRPSLVRPSWIGDAQPCYSLKVRYDYDINEQQTSPPCNNLQGAVWDFSLWDGALWQGTAQNYFETVGVSGMGRHVAIAIRGTSGTALSYVGCDMIGDYGGVL